MRSRFVTAPKSEMGKLLEQTAGEWLAEMDDETRRSFTDTVFALLEATGSDTLRELGGQKWKTAEAMLSSMAGLPKEKRQELRRLFGKLLQAGGQNAAAYLPGRKGEKPLPEEN